MAKEIKNNTNDPATWGGNYITPGEKALISTEAEAFKLLSDDVFLSALTAGGAQLLVDLVLITSSAQAIQLLTGSSKDSSGTNIVRLRPFSDADGFRFRGASFTDTVITGTTKDIDFLLTEERYINGGNLIVEGIGPNDCMTFQVVDKDNIFGYGAGLVLDQFITNFYVSSKTDLNIALAYPAKINAGLYLRLKYTSSHVDGCTVKCNLYLHKKG